MYVCVCVCERERERERERESYREKEMADFVASSNDWLSSGPLCLGTPKMVRWRDKKCMIIHE